MPDPDVPAWIDAATVSGLLAGLGLVVAAALLIYAITRNVVVRLITRLIKRTQTDWDDLLLRRDVPHRLSLLPPLLVIQFGVTALPNVSAGVVSAVQRGGLALIVLVTALAISAGLSAAADTYELLPVSAGRSIKGYVQLARIVLYVFAIVLAFAALLDRSPLVFLGGFGAMMAVILLIFRDTILSFVASVQIASNDLVRVGDWIEMPAFGADGDVLDIALHTVKVQNFDKTITTIPTYKLIDQPFKNWRGMAESGGRRIKRAVHIDVASVRFLGPDEVRRYRGMRLLTPYIEAKLADLGVGDPGQHLPEAALSEGKRRLTNLGTYRAYVEAYVKGHPKLHAEGMTRLVRQLAPGAHGVPIEVYVFVAVTDWVAYEAVQADLFDHLLAVLPFFDLRPYQGPTGADIRAVADSARPAIRPA